MSDETPGPQRSISESSPLRMGLGRFLTAVAAVVISAFAVGGWAASMHIGQGRLNEKIDGLREDTVESRAEMRNGLDELRRRMSAVERGLDYRSATSPSYREAIP